MGCPECDRRVRRRLRRRVEAWDLLAERLLRAVRENV